MQLYFAPMEGVTPWHYRQTHAALFGGVDCYYTPFLNPTEAGLAGKALQEVLPEHNRGVNTVPQILTNNAERFVLLDRLKAYHEQTEPLVAFYRERGKLVEIPDQGSIEATNALIMKALEA